MSEDKMREEHWRQWGIAGMPKDKIRLAEETWKAATEACTALAEAAIAGLRETADQHFMVGVEAGKNEYREQIINAEKEIAALNLTIKDLRGRLQWIAEGNVRNIKSSAQCTHEKYGWEDCENCITEYAEQALAKSEHHNSRALEIKLLEAELAILRNFDQCEHKPTWNVVHSMIAERKAKLAELNKE